jgi:hypothetical protein
VVLSKKLAFIVQSSVVFWCCFGAGSNRSNKEQTKLEPTRLKEETQALVIVRFRVSRLNLKAGERLNFFSSIQRTNQYGNTTIVVGFPLVHTAQKVYE